MMKCNRSLAAVAAVTVSMALMIGSLLLTPVASAQNTAATIQTGVLDTAPDNLADCADVAAKAPGETLPTPDGATAYTLAGDLSEARYVVEEELAGIGANTAIGRTNAILGQIYIGEDGLPASCSRFDVDMRTLKSDESMRDNYLSGSVLETSTYPIATFVLRGIDDLETPLADGDDPTFALIGDLTLHGVTQLVAWEATATIDGDTLTGTAVTELTMDAFSIKPPKVGPVTAIADTMRLEVDINAAKSD